MIRPGIYLLIAVLLLFQHSYVFSDIPDKGRPFTQYYSPRDYRAGSNTFNVVRDSLGVFYFSNDEGVLLFDGSEWSLVPIKDNKPVYWVEIGADGTVLVASTGEIGYLGSLSNGQKVYHSLLESGPEIEFENVWEIAVTSNGAIFRSKKLLIQYQNGEIKTIAVDPLTFDVALTVRDTVYVRIYGKGLYYVDDTQLFPVSGGDFFADIKLNSYLPYDDELLIATRNKGLFLLENGRAKPFLTEADDFFRKYRIYDGCLTQSGNYAYAAYIKGVAIIDKNGKLLQVLDEESGLPEHQYLYVGASDPSSLWMTHAVGVSRAEIMSPVSYFDKSFGIKDVVTDIYIHEGEFYITTLEGFYHYVQDKKQFEPLNKGYLEEFHGITLIKNQVFIAGQVGLMNIQDGELTRLTRKMIHEVNGSLDQDLIFAGSGEGGFDVIREINNEYQVFPLDGFTGQIKKIIPFENKVVLVSLFGELIFVDIKTEKNKVESIISKKIKFGNFDAISLDGQLLIVTPKSWSLYSESGDELLVGELPVVGEVSKIQITSGLDGKSFWVCYEDDKRVDYCEEWSFVEQGLISTGNRFKSGFRINAIFRGEQGVDWFGGDEGVIRYDSNMAFQSQDEPIACHISSVTVNSDSLISRYQLRPEEIVLPYRNTSLQFHFYSDQSFSSNDEIMFQYKLAGLDKEWSSWTAQAGKEYSNLNPGSYTFHVRAKNGFGKISEPELFDFEISSPWYLSVYSFLIYAALIILFTYGYTRWRTKNLKEAKKRLEKLVQGRTIEVELQKRSLEEQSETLRQANATKDQLFSIIGHDLRSPLHSIQGLTDLIKHYRSEKQPEKVDELMEHMSDSVKRLSHLLDNLLSWALNQSGNFKMKKEKVRLDYLVREVVGVLKETALSKDIAITIEMDPKLTLQADPNTLGTILRNLLSNAIKFTHKNGQVWIKAVSNAESLTIEIRDDGVGIPKEKISEVFNLAKTTYGTSNEKGTGLGLVLVEEFIALNGGKMTVESEVEQGTTFQLTFPLNGIMKS